ncbi:hypothetical protein GGR54DRAFT_153876 [Hypoxylon sp. NC1633]|nr:hypothetical protein GGR54DRAFT_153876 [Hypoxylon sp. NC1633]
MSLLTKLQYFPRLPPEIQTMTLDFYCNRRGLRHYLTVSPGYGRFYACMDIDTHKFIHASVDPRTAVRLESRRRDMKWALDHPASGHEFEIVQLIGPYSFPEPGTFAKWIVSAKDTAF